MQVPKRVLDNWTFWYGKEKAGLFKQQTERQFQKALYNWNLKNMKQIDGGLFSLTATNNHVFLKTSPFGEADSPHHQEAKALLKTNCTPQVIEVADNGLTILMQSILNFTPLDKTGKTKFEQAKISGYAQGLFWNNQDGDLEEFTALEKTLKIPNTTTPLSKQMRQKAIYIKSQLIEPEKVLLHNDLHPGNVLINQSVWVIDPKPTVGPKTSDCFGIQNLFNQHLKQENPTLQKASSTLLMLAQNYTQAANIDLNLFLQWMLVKSLLYFATAIEFKSFDAKLILYADFYIKAVENLQPTKN